KRFEVGRAEQDEMLKAQRDVLALKRQLAALPRLLDVVLSSDPTVGTDEESREIERLKRQLANSPDLINAPQGETKETPLQTAAKRDQGRVVEFLISQGADLATAGGSGLTALHEAARSGQKRMVEKLLKASARVDALAPGGRTPLHMAILAGHRQVVQVLLEAGASLNLREGATAEVRDRHGNMTYVKQGTPLALAAARGDRPMVEALLKAGAEVNESSTDPKAQPVLTRMIVSKDWDMVELLLNSVAVPLRSWNGSPMLVAVASGVAPPKILDLLLAKGAKLDGLDPEGSPLLLVAARTGGGEALPWLLKNGVDANATDREGNTALHTLAGLSRQTPGNTQLLRTIETQVELLLKAKAGVNRTNRDGVSPLWHAVYAESEPLVKRLMAAGADPNQPGYEKATLLVYLLQFWRNPRHPGPSFGGSGPVGSPIPVRAGDSLSSPPESPIQDTRVAVLKALLVGGADPNIESVDIRPLDIAMQTEPSVVEALLAHKADPNLRASGSGQTPLESLQVSRRGQAVTYLPVAELAKMEELLRAAGARDDVPDLNAIKLTRTSANYVETMFRKGDADDPNRFTLLELLAVHFGMMQKPAVFRAKQAPDASGGNSLPGRVGVPVAGHSINFPKGLTFTDWKRVLIHRVAPDGQARGTVTINLESMLAGGDCKPDTLLQWGDIVELPERDHLVGETQDWPFPKEMTKLWRECLARRVTLAVKGERKPVQLTMNTPDNPPWSSYQSYFGLLSLLRRPGMVWGSSDLRSVRVIRAESKSGFAWQGTLDCELGTHAEGNTFWLRDGDEIIVPDQPAGQHLGGTVTVVGQVDRPGRIELPAGKSMDLIEAIAASGGLTRAADWKRIKLRRDNAVQNLDWDDAMKNRFELRPGDVVEVGESIY
ncbi:MAG: ankyrin repeat domain-containing protein, partial [Verrucomicrobiota bacterium]